MTTLKPPFRADHVGSLLRTDAVKAARKQFFESHMITQAELQAVEDAAIIDQIKLQESVGLQVVTDGETRVPFGTMILWAH